MPADAEATMAMRTAGAARAARRGFDLPLTVAGLLTTGMALYHFWLPYTFHWGDALTRTQTLRWALFMLNASFSYLLLASGVMTLEIARRGGATDAVSRMILIAAGGYWLFNTCYQLVSPLPLPLPFISLRWAFLGFSVSAVLLYAASLVGSGSPAAETR